jgi:hypothetical protein
MPSVANKLIMLSVDFRMSLCKVSLCKVSLCKVSLCRVSWRRISGGSTVVEHLSHHPKVQGSNPAAAASTRRENDRMIYKRGFFI